MSAVKRSWIGLAILVSAVVVAAGAEAQEKGKPVKVEAKATKPDADGKQTVTVTIAIEKPWHLYANPVGQDDLADAQTSLVFTAKSKPEVLSVSYPAGKLVKDKIVGDYKVYEDTVTIKAEIRRAKGDDSPVEVAVKYQACTDKQCLPQETIKVKAE